MAHWTWLCTDEIVYFLDNFKTYFKHFISVGALARERLIDTIIWSSNNEINSGTLQFSCDMNAV